MRPINTVSVCYRDSPCNEIGTVGGNEGGCSQVELYPYFKCQCKPLWDGYRCQWFNCPCQNGGECRPCIDQRKNCIDDKRKCSCPAGYTGRYCETKKKQNKPNRTPRPPTTPTPTTPTTPTTQSTTKSTTQSTTKSTTTATQSTTPFIAPPVMKPVFGQWSQWSECNLQQEQYRQRFCTDGSTIRHPKCCYGNVSACKRYDTLPDDARKPESATRTCTISAFWSEWGQWSKVCNKKNEGLKTYRRRKCLNGKKILSPGCQGGPPLKKQVKRCPKWNSGTTGTPKTPWTTARPITRPITEPVFNDGSKNALVEQNSTDALMPPTDTALANLMDSLPLLPNGMEVQIDWKTVQSSLTTSPFPPPMQQAIPSSTGQGVNVHYHYQCWPQCLGLRTPYLCIVPSWCAKDYAGKRTFWMFN